MTLTLTFYPPCPPWSLNAERTKHWSWRAKRVRYWREAAAFAARVADAQEQPACQVQVSLPFERTGRRDPSNYLPPVKAIVDGLVDARLWPDDTPNFVTVAEPELRVERGGLVVVRVVPL